MSHPTGEHAEGAKLASGYVEVGVKYAKGMEELHSDFDAVEAHGKTVGENTGRNIVQAMTAAGPKAATGFTDSLKTAAAPAAAAAGRDVGTSFTSTIADAFRNSRLADNADWLFHGFTEKSSLYGAEAASSFHGRFIQVLAANRMDAEAAGVASSAAVAEGVAKGGVAVRNAVEGVGLAEAFDRAGTHLKRIGLREVGDQAGEASEKVARLGTSLAGLASDPLVLAAGAALTVASSVGLITDKLYELGEKWESTFHQIEIQTGATGDHLKSLEGDVKGVAGNVPLAIGQVGSIVATVATSFKDTGEGVNQVATEVAKLQSMVGNVDLTKLGQGFRAFGIQGDAQKQTDVINQMFKASQATQIPINQLIESFTKAAPVANQFHLSIGQTVAVMTQFDQAGINPAATLFTMSHAAKQATKDHKDFTTVLSDEIEQIRHATSEQAKMDLATKYFGPTSGRGGAGSILQAINEGLSLDPATLAQIEKADGLIDKTRQDTMTWGDVWTETKNKISAALEPVGTQLREHVQSGFENIAKWLDSHQGQIVAFGETFVTTFDRIGSGISDAFRQAEPVVKAVIDYLRPAFVSLMPHIQKLGEAFGPLIKAIGTDLLPVVKVVGEALVWAFNEALQILPTVVDAVTGIVHALTDVFHWLHDNIGPIWETVWSDAGGVIGPVATAVEGIWHAGEKVVGYIGTNIAPIFKNVFGIVMDLLRPVADIIGEQLKVFIKVGEYVGGHLGGIFKTLGGILHDTFAPALDVIKEIFKVLKDVGSFVGDVLKPGLKGLADATKDIKGLLDKVPGFGPGHADGGPIAHGQTGLALGGYGGGDVVPAMLEPGEHVFTKEEVRAGGGHQQIYLLRTLIRHGLLGELLGDVRGYDAGGDVQGKSWWDAVKSAFNPDPRTWGLTGDDGPSGPDDSTRTMYGSPLSSLLDVLSGRHPNLEEGPGVGLLNQSAPLQYFDGGGEVGNLAGVRALLAAESGRTPYVFGGYSPAGIDCSGLVAEAVQVYLGENVNVGAHPMSTGNEASWLAAHGFKQGTGPEGSFRVGFYNGGPGGGHTALTLPDGTNAESGGSGGGVRLGGGAAGANSKEFTDHWYLPPRTIVEPGGYGGTGSGGSGGYGGAGGSSGASPQQVQAADTAVTGAQGKLDVANQRVTEAQQAVGAAKTPKAQEAANQRLRDAQAARDRAQSDLDTAQSTRAGLTGDTDPKALIAAKDRVTDANQRLHDAQSKLDQDRANPKIKPSQITADENAIAAAKDRVAKAEQHLQEVESRPPKKSKDGKDADFVGTIGDAVGKGLSENLPQKFSDPMGWSGVKSLAALAKFGAGMAGAHGSKGGQGALTVIGDLLSGSGGGVAHDFATLAAGGTPGEATGASTQATSSGEGITKGIGDLIKKVPGFTPPSAPSGAKDAGNSGGSTANINTTQHITNHGVDPVKATQASTAALHNGIRSDIKLARLTTAQT